MDICKFSGSPVFAPGTSDLLVGAAVYVFNSGTTTPATVYQDVAGTVPHSYPIVVGSDGLIPAIYWEEGTFRVRVETSIYENTPVWDFDGIKGEIIPGTGGGGGTPPPDDELVKTGHVVLEFRSGQKTGFVRANGRTIGSAASSATERANSDCYDLFVYGWNNWNNADCPVPGGRGANADSDWNANKTLALPNGPGRAIVLLDDMGAGSALVSQRFTTITTTNASAVVNPASISGLTRGMYVTAAGVPAGTTITDINPITGALTLSNAATATGSGVGARFSAFVDATRPAAVGGASSMAQNTAEMATHAHPVVDLGHSHGPQSLSVIFGNGGDNDINVQAGGGQVLSQLSIGTTASTTGISLQNAGSGLAMSIMQPGIGLTAYIKL